MLKNPKNIRFRRPRCGHFAGRQAKNDVNSNLRSIHSCIATSLDDWRINSTFYLYHNNTSPLQNRAMAAQAGIGVTLITVGHRLKVSAVKADGAAAASGNVKVGDFLVALNGICVTSEAHAKQLILSTFGSSLQAELSRGGQSINVTLWRSGVSAEAKCETLEQSKASSLHFTMPSSSSVAITPLHSSRPADRFIYNSPITPWPQRMPSENSATPQTPAEDRVLSIGDPVAPDHEPFFIPHFPIQLPAELQTLPRFSFETLVLSESHSDSPIAQYHSLDAISCIGEGAVAQSRGCVFAVALFDDRSAAIIPHTSLLNVESGLVPIPCSHSSQVSTAEGLLPRVNFWTIFSVASDTNRVTFAAVPPLSVMLFPGTGLFHTKATILDMCLPDTPRVCACVRGYSLALPRHFQNLKQLHLFGDKKAAKALRLQLTEARQSKVTSPEKGEDCIAEFEIFLLGKVDLGVCFGTAGILDHRLEFRAIAPSIVDIEVLVLKTRYLQNLVDLLLYECEIGPDGAAVLAKILSSDSHRLNYLSLTRNPLNDDGCSGICNSLIGNTCLTELSLGRVNATSITADHVSNLLLRNSVIKKISLYENPIEEAGFLKIFDALQTNSSLTSLSFQECSMFNHFCATELKRLLQSNVNLIHVGLSGNPIGREMDQEIEYMYGPFQCFLKQSSFAP